MAWFLTVWIFLLLLLLEEAAGGSISSSSSSRRCYKRVYSFGDSLADTGNTLYGSSTLPQASEIIPSLNLPYGETYFHQPTGRWSDGRLIIDFIAEQMGIPLVKPYLGIKSGKIKDWNPIMEGVNFAVGGATALDSSFFIDKGIFASNNYSLSVQLDWFMNLLPSLSNSSSGLKEILGSSLFLVGEIGGNDFNHPLREHKSIKEIRKYVPLVINEISSAINKLIEVGAQTLVVPGNLPIGCNFKYLIMFQTSNKSEYDEAGCLKSLNKFVQYYNDMLYAELNRLRLLHPTTTIIYADYYNSALILYRSPTQFGITEPISSACCPLTDVNNPTDLHCGSPGVIACVDPSQYIPWDGWHLTEAAYKLIAQGLFNGPFTNPKLDLSCVHNSEI
ncbi:GDSL esterase/lipase At1g28600-like [Arachis stenosperma]|uniref:GDSL esterase/lipase At1g28600-like n=1 Tax=Arachis stenosperma TaxID=217475 RepID=UPI0025AB6D38|nr:GDSL esterase/lipase At1g28600-like [Arachis stenosperma]